MKNLIIILIVLAGCTKPELKPVLQTHEVTCSVWYSEVSGDPVNDLYWINSGNTIELTIEPVSEIFTAYKGDTIRMGVTVNLSQTHKLIKFRIHVGDNVREGQVGGMGIGKQDSEIMYVI